MPTRAPASETVALPPLSFRAEIVPASLDVDARTVDVIFSTGADVERVDFWSGHRYVESLEVSARAVRLDRLNNGAPLLDAHSAWSVADQLGAVERGSAKLVDGRGVARVRFSKRPTAEAVFADVRDGIVSNVSVGYRVHKYERTPADDETHTPEKRRAVDWEPFEISAVPMGADDGAKFRNADERARVRTEPCEIVTLGGMTMPEHIASFEPNGEGPAAAPPSAPPEPTAAELATLAERKRVAGIIHAATACRIRRDDPRVTDMIASGMTLEVAQGKFLDALREIAVDTLGPPAGPAGVAVVTRDALDSVWTGLRGALLHRINPQSFALDDNARQYR